MFNTMFNTMFNNNQLVAPLEHAKYITCSSFLFLIPSFYAFNKDQHIMSIVLFFASIMSINHWRHPIYSWRRIADHISAKIAFIVCLVNGLMLAPSTSIFIIITELISFSLFLYCYYMSEKYCNKNIDINDINHCWWKYHALFHSFSVCSQMLIIYSI